MNCSKVSPGLKFYDENWCSFSNCPLRRQESDIMNTRKEEGVIIRLYGMFIQPIIHESCKKNVNIFLKIMRVTQLLGRSIRDKWCQRPHEEESPIGLMFSNHPLNTFGERKTRKAPLDWPFLAGFDYIRAKPYRSFQNPTTIFENTPLSQPKYSIVQGVGGDPI